MDTLEQKPVKWEKVLQRNLPPLAWTGIAENDGGIQLGPLTWSRGSEIVAKYKTDHFYVIQNSNKFYNSNISEIISDINIEFIQALDEANGDVIRAVESVPGSTKQYLHSLNTIHTKCCGLMVMAYDLINDIKSKIEEEITDQNINDYLTIPWQPTAIQREQTEVIKAKEQMAIDPNKKAEILQKIASDFGYLHQDYLGQPWTTDDYETSFNDNITLKSGMNESYDMSMLSDYQQWLVTVFKKMTYLYEEGRNAMVRTVWAMKETASKISLDPQTLLYMTAQEIDQYTRGEMDTLPMSLIEKRKQAFALYFNYGKYNEYSGEGAVEGLIKDQGVGSYWEIKEEVVDYLKGSVGFKGCVKGKVRLVFTQADANSVEEGEIIVSPMTQVEFLSGIRKCGGIVTDEGGIICHAAIVAREFSKPCILGTQKATKVLKNGDVVEMDANSGIIKIITNI